MTGAHKPFCPNCNKLRELGHLFYVYPLQEKVVSGDRVLYVFYDFDTTQDTACTDTWFVHLPNLMCVQQVFSACEDESDVDVDCRMCGKTKHSFWMDPVGDLTRVRTEALGWQLHTTCTLCSIASYRRNGCPSYSS
jgi:translation initiation factor IF-1